jgi:hypothetical protein
VCQFLPPDLPNSQPSVTFPQREARPQSNRSFGEKLPSDHSIEHADGHDEDHDNLVLGRVQ